MNSTWVDSLSDGERWAYGIAAAAVMGLMVAVVTHRLALRRDRSAAKRTAATAFRSVVDAALVGLYPLPLQWPSDIDHALRAASPTLQTAVLQFRPCVPWWRRRAFDRAWFQYRSATGRKIDLECYHHYMAFGSNPDPKGKFRRNVDALLSFALIR
jgi:hypothetical protein